MELSTSQPKGNGCVYAVLAICAGAFLVMSIAYAMSSLNINVFQNSHADKHSSANSIRNCNNIEQIWVDGECKRYFLLKKLSDGKYGQQIVEPVKSVKGQNYAVEVTSYIPKCGVLCKIEQWLLRRGATRVYPP